MTNSSSIQMDDPGQEPATLAEKLKDHYNKGSPTGSKCTRFARALFLFQTTTQLYVTLNHLIPFVFEDFDPWLLYCFKVMVSYVCVISLANWLCIICYSNVYVPSKDRPDIDVSVFNNPAPDRFGANLALVQNNNRLHQGNGHAVIDCDVTEKGGLPWKHCKRCDMNVPPRTHHCKFCGKCILRRDHHCHLVGCCIGHWNQRYFVILAFYAMVSSYVGAYMTITYLRHHHEHDDSLWKYFLPNTMIKMVTGNVSVLQALLIFHAYLLCVFGPIGNIYFLTQLSIIVQGKTLHEVAYRKNLKVTSGVEENLRLVFGEYWMINFLFPAQIIFKQENDGMRFDGIKLGPPSPKDKDKTDKKSVD